MKLKVLFSCLYLIIISFNGFSQELFPASWEGNYKGELQIYGVDSIAMRVTMQLDIAKKTDSLYQWKITYNLKGKEDIRNYELKVVDVKNGHYIIDEKNSIAIDSYFKTGIFTSFFKVMDSFIVSTYTKKENLIIFEIISADGKNSTSTGNTSYEGETIPEVNSYLVNGRQKAILKKY
ncbi:hypothetical protein BX611_2706 [Lutibacter oceani]|uniref:Uncharacterized protein n=1 Tax=Lutibacter oceani TaxID=1853311 RepID=A0A3D9RIY3_9FLAO|nr:hypothetical protein [Lutibacter oceani]REE79810.1 hypothetical protein BX611_2706 [Lutibacter oceani]